MTEICDKPEERRVTWIEVMMVVALLTLITISALRFDSDPWRSALLRYRSDSLEATAAFSLQNKAVVEGYTKCWMDKSISPAPKCALDAVALGRSQGRTEAEVSKLIGSMGIFEEGCSRTDSPNLISVMKNDDLKALMATWCQAHGQQDTP